MKVTKHEHSTLIVDKGETRIVLDPGGFLSLADFPHVDAVVITHEHADHWTPEALDRVAHDSPDAVFYGPQGLADAVAASDSGVEITVVHAGETVTVGDIELSFHGGKHNVIHSSIPIVDNLGVLVDGDLFHPGDSYTVPEVPVGTLAAPVGAPWLKVAEMMDYILAVAPKRAFPIHEMTLSRAGAAMHRERQQWSVEQNGGSYTVLEPGESIDL